MICKFCGGGSFLDFVNTPSKSVIAIEPNENYYQVLKERGYFVYSYAANAMEEWMEKVNVITSFDVNLSEILYTSSH